MVAREANRIPKASAASRKKLKGGRVAPGAKANSAAIVMEEARRAGLFEGARTEHLGFRAPKALIEAAKRESGASGPTELGLLALAMLAQPDPTAKFLRETRGALGADHDLDT